MRIEVNTALKYERTVLRIDLAGCSGLSEIIQWIFSQIDLFRKKNFLKTTV